MLTLFVRFCRLANLRRITFIPLTVAALALLPGLWTANASADATPVGPLVNESVTTASTTPGARVTVTLPPAEDGLVWRLARDVDPKVLRQLSEGEVGNNVVVVFAATGVGTVRVVFALTRGETPQVFRTVTQVVHVR